MPAAPPIAPLFAQADALERQGRLTEAEQAYRGILRQQPRYFFALHALGNLLCDTGRPDQGAELLAKAVRLMPEAAAAHCNLGRALHRQGRLDRALLSLNRAISLQPDMAEAHNNRGNLLRDLGRMDEALAGFARAIALRPDFAEAHSNRGNVLEALGRHAAAVASHDAALSCDPASATAHFNRGVSLASLHRLSEAIASYDAAIALRPDFADALCNRAHVLLDLDRPDAALASCDAALAANPDHAGAHYNRGLALQHLGRLEDAIASLERSAALAPDQDFLAGDLLAAQLQACDWRDFGRRSQTVLAAVATGRLAATPFTLLTLTDDPALQHQAARAYSAAKYPTLASPLPVRPPATDGRIRIGYFSADFRNHPVADLMVEVLEAHDRTRFEVCGFAFGPPSTHPMRARIEAACARFHDIRDLSDSDAAALARSLELDIAIDLGGHSLLARPGIFAHRAAPVQAAYIGYVGTTGADHIDHVIADRITIPAADVRHFSEHVIHLPVYQANPARRAVAPSIPTRAACGLPEQGFIFCCFNQSFKILPAQFDAWMTILRRTEGSVLWLLAQNDAISAHLRAAADTCGVDPARLVFAPRVPLPDYMARYKLADLFLDTHPYNAGATASDALWAGVPVLTRRGASYAGRMAASLLTALDLPDMIAHDTPDYIDRAAALAADPPALADIRQRLAGMRDRSPLYDTAAFTRSLEAACRSMLGAAVAKGHEGA